MITGAVRTTNSTIHMEVYSVDNIGFGETIAVYAIMYIVTIFAVIILIWSVLTVIPMPNYHDHTDDCYTVDGQLVCGKDEGEFYLSKSRVKSPMQVLIELDEAHTDRQANMTPWERIKDDSWIFKLLGSIIVVLSVKIVVDKVKRKKSNNGEEDSEDVRL